jgi:hypothetical protein
MKRKLILLTGWLCITFTAFAQDTTAIKGKLTFSGYAEIYYGYDFDHPANHNRPAFVYSYNRTNEVNLNLGFLKAAYADSMVHANLAFMAGTYTNANLKDEPGVLKNIYEAFAGIRLSKKANFWLDAGVMDSHIGYESAIGKNDWTLTRNIASDNTPYFETGARLTYTTADGKLSFAALYLNGWQRIEREDGNNKAAGGLEITYTPSDRITLNYSNYLGSEGADSVSLRRFYNNFYAILTLTKNLGLTVGFDYGIQQKTHLSSTYNQVLSPVIVGRYQFAAKWAMAARIEYYKDGGGVFIQTPNNTPFKTTGYSINLDYSPVTNAVIRLEGKIYDSPENVFLQNGSFITTSPVITASLAIAF